MAAISKRLRYEVLRRDGHACYYCGRKPPEVKLTVDHVVPVALGGTDEPSNLVAACGDCNGGKTSSSPDAPLVAAVADNAARWAEAVQAAADGLRGEVAALKEACESFDDAWKSGLADCWRPEDWDKSVQVFLKSGLPLEVLEDCVAVAAGSRAPRSAKWRYMCKVAWTRIAEIRNQAQVLNGSAAEGAGARDAHEEGRLSIARELLDELSEEERTYYLEHADYSEFADEPLTESEIASGALSHALNDIRCDLDYLCRRVQEVLEGMPHEAGKRALTEADAGERFKSSSPLARRTLRLTAALYKAEDYLQLPAARELLDSLPPPEREEWLSYARAMYDQAGGLNEDEWIVRAAQCARVIKKGRYYPVMCEAPGEHIKFCPAKGAYKVRLSDSKCCGPEGPDDHPGHIFCAAHTEELVDGTFTVDGRTFSAADFEAVPSEDLVPF